MVNKQVCKSFRLKLVFSDFPTLVWLVLSLLVTNRLRSCVKGFKAVEGLALGLAMDQLS